MWAPSSVIITVAEVELWVVIIICKLGKLIKIENFKNEGIIFSVNAVNILIKVRAKNVHLV